MSSSFGDLRSLLQQPPDARTWRAICEAVSSWAPEDEELHSVILPYGASILARWPDALRDVPRDWQRDLFDTRRPPMPWLTWARSLKITQHKLGIDDTRALITRPELAELRHLHLHTRLDQTTFGLLMQATYLRHLEVLSFDRTNIDDRQFARFINAPLYQHGLRALRLSWSGVGNRSVRALADAAHLAHLERLTLQGLRGLRADGAWRALITSPHLDALRELTLDKMWLGPPHLEVLIESDLVERLTTLRLSRNNIDDVLLSKLLATRDVSKLERLGLRNTGIDGDLSRSAAARHNLGALRELDLSHNGLNTAQIAPLLDGDSLPHLETLLLRGNALGDDPEELATMTPHGALTDLDLSTNHLGARGARALAGSPLLRHVENLSLYDNDLGDAGLAALLGARDLPRLRKLDLGQNQLGEASVELLATTQRLPALHTLRLHDDDIDDEDVLRIARNPALPHLIPF